MPSISNGGPLDSRCLRVLVVAHNAVGVSNRARAAALARAPGLEVTLLTPAWWDEEGQRLRVTRPEGDGYAWHVGRTLLTGNATRYIYVSHLFGLVRRLQPDVVDVFEEPHSLAAAQTVLAREIFAPHAALVCYSAVNLHQEWRLPYRVAERYVLGRADGAYVPNADVPPVLRAKGMRAPVAEIPLGVDVDRFAGASPLPLEARLGGASRPYVGFLGRLEPVKGVDVLVAAAGLLRQVGTVVLAGDGAERNALERQVQRAGLGERVRFLPPLPFAEVPAFLKALDVLVLPSVTLPPLHKEQFGRVLAEAMAAGVPVVGSSSGAIPEVVDDAGLVVRERDARALADALDRLVAHPALRAELAARGRRRAGERFAWPVVARRTVELYEAAVAGRHSRWLAASGRGRRSATGRVHTRKGVAGGGQGREEVRG